MNSAAGSGEENLRSVLNKAELEALDALKLQYFQNATKYLAKGDYDNALTEIKRVLLIDPEHRLAREYEIRVSELQASRAQTPKADPPPPSSSSRKESARVVPVVAEAVSPTPAPVRARASGKTWLYVGIIAILLMGTAGILTLERVNDEEQPPTVRVAAVTPQAPAPAPQPAEAAMKEEPTPAVEVPLAEAKRTSATEEKSVTRPEPVRKEQPAASPERTSTAQNKPSKTADVKQNGTAGIGLLAAVTEKKVEPPAAPVKKEEPISKPEVKLASAEAAHPEPTAPSIPFVATEKEPKLLRMEKVRLPEMALRTRTSGDVKAKVLVDKDGNPQQVEIVSSTNELLNQAVVDALQKSSYSPGMMGNDPVSAWLLIPFKFK